ncbi:hypothetical protein LSCM1_01463 [Leishmania martiniquensis]|uniref:Uncharacterized protein n=1 Tax=Leishmania martiniquensis TaxID=1580590 RepID=A0A836KCK1_9TRYP|nr:hypothetical protein LSCM1_01463 [Leishmania martiniquensis]
MLAERTDATAHRMWEPSTLGQRDSVMRRFHESAEAWNLPLVEASPALLVTRLDPKPPRALQSAQRCRHR